MKAAALEYAADLDKPQPFELILLGYIDRFGVRAVMGRDELSAGEIRRMFTTENIVKAYLSRKSAMDGGDVVEWAKNNQFYVSILADVEKIDAD